ncbi:NAD-dependent protein deacetylase [Lentzea sp. NEAU-D13]|uniref:NAD-dependent protein deacetylase n=1 Tax=Lentzea alba TaxID=2714351 RepID=A0A7C9RTQ8_9PSEU|nr:NAD-dependent protein deacetylase [Lentzea alba]NGY60482.1 NAD-dependent protein deacetylase [Lentzea alba]
MRTRPTLSWSPSGPSLPRTSTLTDVVPIVVGGDVLVLSGAGLSTESGIPDYRGEGGSLRKHTPMTYEEFTSSAASRQRYWARSHVGWRTIARAHPNAGHHAVTRLSGKLSGVITQNVDGLHQAAGTSDVVELHGGLDRVICLGCGLLSPRVDLDRRLREANPDFAATTTEINPDGDVFLPEEQVRGFEVVGCVECGGVLKPDVVFFGENVPRPRVEQCYSLVDNARSLLVLGSSLTVMSGLRFVRRAADSGIPVVIINRGVTRGDPYASLRVDLPLGKSLTELADVVLQSGNGDLPGR